MTLLPTALLVLAAAAAPRAAIVVHATGFTDAEIDRLEQKIGAEVSTTGVELWSLPRAVEVKAMCLESRACAKEMLRAAEASFLLSVEMLRVGSQLQVSSRLLDAEGRILSEADTAGRTSALPGTLISAEVLEPLKAAVAATGEASETSDTGDTGESDGVRDVIAVPGVHEQAALDPPGEPAIEPAVDAAVEPTEPRERTRFEQVEAESPAPSLSPLAIGGVTALATGALVAVASAAVIPGQYGVTRDPASLGTQKEAAAGAVVTAGALVVVGGLTGLAGGGLLLFGLQP